MRQMTNGEEVLTDSDVTGGSYAGHSKARARDFGGVFNSPCYERSLLKPMVAGCDNPGNEFTITVGRDVNWAAHAMLETGEMYISHRDLVNSPTGEDFVQDIADGDDYYVDVQATADATAAAALSDALD
jgi:hypothetical protein